MIFPWCEEFKLYRKSDEEPETGKLEVYESYERFEKEYVEEKIHRGFETEFIETFERNFTAGERSLPTKTRRIC